MNLMEVGRGGRAKVLRVEKCDAYRRLLDLGITPGTYITVNHIAPFGGTVLVALRGYTLALRANAGRHIIIEELLQ